MIGPTPEGLLPQYPRQGYTPYRRLNTITITACLPEALTCVYDLNGSLRTNAIRPAAIFSRSRERRTREEGELYCGTIFSLGRLHRPTLG